MIAPMATIVQRGNKWRVQIRLRGVTRSNTFERHADAKAWAARTESQILDGLQGNASRNKTFGDIAQRYLEEVTPQKRGQREESYRIGRILQAEPTRVFRRQFILSHATLADSSNWR